MNAHIDLFAFGHNIKVERLAGAVVIREAQIARCGTLRLSNYLPFPTNPAWM
jgi:hypothetical protein